jgi:phage terminase large subunit
LTNVPYDPNLGVETWWDLGLRDATAVWFVQRFGQEIRLIDYDEESGLSLADWCKRIKEKPYHYTRHIGPHDLESREYSTGMTRLEFARTNDLRFDVAPKVKVTDGIDSVRRLLARCWFDETKCYRGVEALKSYRKEWDAKLQVFRPTPLHDWSSHGADAFRTGAVASRPKSSQPRQRTYTTRDPFAHVRR